MRYYSGKVLQLEQGCGFDSRTALGVADSSEVIVV